MIFRFGRRLSEANVELMIKWSRVQLALSILSAAGLWQTLRERVDFAGKARAGRFGRPSATPRPLPAPVVYDLAGSCHVHSTYSDGTGTVADIADAAARAGSDFVFLTDHSSIAARLHGEDGWRANGKTLIAVGAEIATDTGHLLVADIPNGFDLEAGVASDIMQRVRCAGGYGYIALPCDLKDHWRNFDVREETFGLEVFNLSAVARTKINIPSFLLALARYRGQNPISAFSFIAGRPTRELKLWDRLSFDAHERGLPIVQAIGSIDAHAVMRFGGKDYPYPTYEQIFKTCRTHALLPEPPSRTSDGSEHDLAMLHSSLRSGHCYISYDNFGDPTGFSFQARTEKETVASMGDSYTMSSREKIIFEIRSPYRKSILKLFRNGKLIAKVRGQALTHAAPDPGVYRVEIFNYRLRIGSLCLGTHPWIFSNPIQLNAA